MLDQAKPGAGRLILLYGRRRVGKSRLLLHWSAKTGVPTTYWAAEKENAHRQRRKLYACLLGVSVEQAPTFAS